MKKKLLITTDCFYPRIDGIAVFLKNLLPFLAKHYDITIIAPKFQGKKPNIPAKLIQIPIGAKVSDIPVAQIQYYKIKKLVSESDIILNNTLGTIGFCTIKAAKKLKKPLVSYVHSYDWELFSLSLNKFVSFVEWLTKKYVKRCYKKVSKLIFPSEDLKSAFEKLKIKTPSQVIPVTIPTKQFKPKKSKRKIPVIGYCGRIAREKGITYLLDAYKELKKKHKVKLLLVGDGLLTLKFRAAYLGAKLEGRVYNPEDYYPKMDMFVLPSLTETTSLATKEAMSSGLAIIATPVGKVTGFIRKSKGGILVPKEDPKALQLAIESLITQPELRKRFGKNARAYAVKNFDIAKSAHKLIKLLNSTKA